ncbi:MAG: class I SAM-dependent methyltransferase [Phycisphaerales bacterium]|nr:class I SAM-dependent methyltransferase [Phycisphaerales bacterium]
MHEDRSRHQPTVAALAADLPEGLRLAEEAGGLELRTADERPGQGVRATPFLALERGDHAASSHPLGRILRGVNGPVIDATAGLGADAGVAAALGREVLCLERDRVVHALLADALQRARGEAELVVAARMRLQCADACEALPTLSEEWQNPGVVMLDPMFPPRRRSSALPPKGMQRLRELLEAGPLGDVGQLLRAAHDSPARRVVLKRPPEAVVDYGECGKPTYVIETKLLRWEVWDRG